MPSNWGEWVQLSASIIFIGQWVLVGYLLIKANQDDDNA